MSGRYSTYGRANKRVKVAHRMTPYDYALRSVILRSNERVSGECQNILEGEALMESTSDRSKYYASQRHVHSDQRALGNNGSLQDALKDLRFAGFAVTGFDQKYGVYEQGFVASIGGVDTVMNTGDGVLETGKEALVLPTAADNNVRIKGVNRTKSVFSIVHASHDEQNQIAGRGTHYEDAVIAAANLVTDKEVNDADDFNGLDDDERARAVNYLKKFAVGTVIRGGRKFQPVDIVLHANSTVINVS